MRNTAPRKYSFNLDLNGSPGAFSLFFSDENSHHASRSVYIMHSPQYPTAYVPPENEGGPYVLSINPSMSIVLSRGSQGQSLSRVRPNDNPVPSRLTRCGFHQNGSGIRRGDVQRARCHASTDTVRKRHCTTSTRNGGGCSAHRNDVGYSHRGSRVLLAFSITGWLCCPEGLCRPLVCIAFPSSCLHVLRFLFVLQCQGVER